MYRLHAKILLSVSASVLISLFASAATAAQGDCSQPISSADTPVASDCLFILSAAVGIGACTPDCICDPSGDNATTATDALVCLNAAVGAEIELACPCVVTTTTTTTSSTSTTSTTVAAAMGSCPVVVEDRYHSGVGAACATNADCAAGACDDAGAGRCLTPTELDLGWTGNYHDFDGNDGYAARLAVSCEAETAPCAVCEVLGIDASAGNCRCENDNHTHCDTPFAADADDCGGDVCLCYLGPPVSFTGGNTPQCWVPILAEDVGGTVNVDSGARALSLAVRAVVHGGENLTSPCPYCSGDTVARDGQRDGTCVLGDNAGESCDVDGLSPTFPAPGGAGHSLDCMPSAGKNRSGTGLRLRLDPSTGSRMLSRGVECGFPPFVFEQCHCGHCSDDTQVACSSNDDCAAGTCTMAGSGNPLPDQCNEPAGCVDSGGGSGECVDGPADRFCDGIVRAGGRGFIACLTNNDCAEGTIGVDAGACALSGNRPCFADTIFSTGTPDPLAPVTQSLFCTPQTAGAGFNTVMGVPGPARLLQQLSTQPYCDTDLARAYVPGIGGCQ